MSRHFGGVRQNGYLVADLDQAADHWIGRLGVGPFFVVPDVQMVDPMYRGQPCDARISIALANSGDLQIELVVQHNDAPSIYREWLDRKRYGLHHVGFFVDDIDAAIARLPEPAERVQHGRNFCYLDTEAHPGTFTELICVQDGMQELFGMIRAAAEGWDGTDPIRRLG